MIFLLYGENDFLIAHELKRIIAELEGKGCLVFSELSLKETKPESLKSEFFQKSIFGETRIIFLKDAFLSSKDDKKIAAVLKEIAASEKNVLIIKEKPDKKSSIFKIIKESGKIYELNNLEGIDLKNWAAERFALKKGKIEDAALEKLVSYAGSDLWLLSNEIDKLVAYKKGESITERDVENMVPGKPEGDIFKALDLMAQKRTRESINVFYGRIEKGDHVLYLLTMIAFQIRNLLLIKASQREGVDCGKLGLHPFVLKKTLRQSSYFSEEDLRRIYKEILKTETNIKTGKTDPRSAFDLLLAGVK